MFTSEKKLLRRSAVRYFAAAAFCILFAAVYEHFSHGVWSNYMVCLFVWPLLGGVPALLLPGIRTALMPCRAVRHFWASGVATLTLGSCLAGVFEIYGAPSALVRVYWWAGGVLLAAALIAWLRPRRAAHQA